MQEKLRATLILIGSTEAIQEMTTPPPTRRVELNLNYLLPSSYNGVYIMF